MGRDNSDNNGFGDWGGYMEAKITKLGEQFSAASDPFRQSTLFNGISIFVNGLTNPSADELKRIMMVHGGIYHHYELSSTTFVIASNLPDVKVRNMNTSKIISPNWVVDCVRAKRILDYTKYLLYTSHNSKQPKLKFSKSKDGPQNSLDTMSDAKTNSGNIVRNLQALATALNVRGTESDKQTSMLGQAENQEVLEQPSTSVETDVTQWRQQANAAALGSNETVGILEESSVCDIKEKQICLTHAEASAAVTTIQTSHNKSNTARTAVDPQFLQEFFKKSRLHHIATLGAELKDYVCKLRRQHSSSVGFPDRQKLKHLLFKQGAAKRNEYISACTMHIDMDCFFVSVGLRTRPHLRDKPVAVTHSQGGATATDVPVHEKADRRLEMELFAKRFEEQQHNDVLRDKVRSGFIDKISLSEIASCNYAAREKGIRNGMFVGHALQLCPDLVTIPYDFNEYREVAYALYDTIAAYTLNIEAKSCDEMFVDLTDVLQEIEVDPMEFVKAVRDIVFERTACPCSAGIGANRLQARLATKRAKPNGQFYLKAADVSKYMVDIPVSELPTVGESTAYTLKKANVLTCGELQALSLPELQKLVGKEFGKKLYNYSRGIDNTPLEYEKIRKSVSAEVNYGIRFVNNKDVETFLRQLCAEVHSRLQDIDRKAKCITLKVMVRAKDAPIEASKFMGHGICDTLSKSTRLSDYTNSIDMITDNVLKIMMQLKIPPNELRGIGIQLTKLNEHKPNVLKMFFNKMEEKQRKNEKEQFEVQNKENAVTQPVKLSKEKPIKRKSHEMNGTEKDKPNIMDMLQALPAKKRIRESSPVLPDNIDPEVFQALPADIRAEIMKSKSSSDPGLMAQLEPLDPFQKPTSYKEPCRLTLPDNIDPEVFKALPNNIREEIIAAVPQQTLAPTIMRNASAANNQSVLNESDFQPTTSKAAAMKRLRSIQAATCVENLASAMTVPSKIPTASSDLSHRNMVDAITSDTLCDWVENSQEPLEYDVEVYVKYACDLVASKRLTMVYDQIYLLKRLILHIRKHNCHWHDAFKRILERVNCAMQHIYGNRKLLMEPNFNCAECN